MHEDAEIVASVEHEGNKNEKKNYALEVRNVLRLRIFHRYLLYKLFFTSVYILFYVKPF